MSDNVDVEYESRTCCPVVLIAVIHSAISACCVVVYLLSVMLLYNTASAAAIGSNMSSLNKKGKSLLIRSFDKFIHAESFFNLNSLTHVCS